MKTMLLTLLALLALPVIAAPLGVSDINIATRNWARYSCDDAQKITVNYLNATSGQGFALLRIEGKTMLFVDTLSASGAKYVAGPYVWWTKGANATLYDQTAAENAPPMLANCHSGSLSKR